MLDIYNKISGLPALNPALKITATTNGTAVDITSLNDGANRLCFMVIAGVITDGTYTFTLQDSPDGTTWTNVAAPYLQGPSQGVFSSSTVAGTINKLGYLGNPNGAARYVRLVTTVASATTGGFITAIAILDGFGFLPAV